MKKQSAMRNTSTVGKPKSDSSLTDRLEAKPNAIPKAKAKAIPKEAEPKAKQVVEINRLLRECICYMRLFLMLALRREVELNSTSAHVT